MKAARPRIGDRKWFVTWRPAFIYDECGDVDRDATEHAAKQRCFTEQAEAEAFAQSVLPSEVYGIVDIDYREFVPYDEDDAHRYPHAGFWEDVKCGTCDDEGIGYD